MPMTTATTAPTSGGGQHGHQEVDVEVDDEGAGGRRAHPDEGELAQADLARPPGEHHDRDPDQGVDGHVGRQQLPRGVEGASAPGPPRPHHRGQSTPRAILTSLSLARWCGMAATSRMATNSPVFPSPASLRPPDQQHADDDHDELGHVHVGRLEVDGEHHLVDHARGPPTTPRSGGTTPCRPARRRPAAAAGGRGVDLAEAEPADGPWEPGGWPRCPTGPPPPSR